MKKHYLPALLILFYVGDAAALPDCPSSGYFDNCYGAYEWDDGDKYIGEFKDDNMHGQGTYTFADGEKYVGEFKDDRSHGQGTYTYANGDKFVGEYKDGKRNGQGTYFFGPESEWSGDKFVGEYKDGKRNGLGTYTWADGDSQTGYYLNNEFVPDICEDMGLTKGSDAFGNCVLKLIDD